MFLKYFLLFLINTHIDSTSAGRYHKVQNIPFVRSSLLPDSSVCGPVTQSKIYGGKNTELDEFPWLALLGYQREGKKEYECGGFLINNRYVVTAAHCIDNELKSVRLGEWNLKTDPDCIDYANIHDCAPPVVDIPIEETIVHKSNNSDISSRHDVALLRLKHEVKYSDFIKPVCLPTSVDEMTKTYVGQKLVVAGWGKTEKKDKSDVKLKVIVPVRNLSTCEAGFKNAYNIDVTLNDNHLCAGGEKGKDSCLGDSGGPLMTLKLNKDGDIRVYAVGMVSNGPAQCGSEDQPALYVRVVKYVSWIVDNLKP